MEPLFFKQDKPQISSLCWTNNMPFSPGWILWLPEIPGQCLFPKFLPPQSLCRRLHSSVLIYWEPLLSTGRPKHWHGQMGYPGKLHQLHSPVETTCSCVGGGRSARREEGWSPSGSIQVPSMVSIHCSLWLRIWHVTQNVSAGRTRTPGLGAVTVFCLADKKYLLGMHCNNKASSAYIWVILYKSGSHENHWLLLQMMMLRQGTYWVP